MKRLQGLAGNPPEQPADRKTISPLEAARELGVSHQRINQLLLENRVRGTVKEEGRWRIPAPPGIIPSFNTGRREVPAGYVSAKEAAKDLNVTAGMVRQLLAQERIKGATKLGCQKWIMPTPVTVKEAPKRGRKPKAPRETPSREER